MSFLQRLLGGATLLERDAAMMGAGVDCGKRAAGIGVRVGAEGVPIVGVVIVAVGLFSQRVEVRGDARLCLATLYSAPPK
jgi:hypothetical protein